MIRKKMNDKLKIAIAVTAVIVIAVAAVAVNALTAGSSVDSQSDLYANQSGGGQSVMAAAETDAVSISAIDGEGHESLWSGNSASDAVIGRYNYDYYITDEVAIESTVIVNDADLTVTAINVTGVRFDGTAIPSDKVIVNEAAQTISLTQAGNYTAEVALSNGAVAAMYAQVGRCQLAAPTYDDYNNQEYSGDPIEAYIQVFRLSKDFDEVLEITSVSGVIEVNNETFEISDYTVGVGGQFFVVDAGEYSIDVKIKDVNYEWEDNPGSATATAAGFTVKQACISGYFNPKGTPHLDYVPNMDKNAVNNLIKFIPSGNYDVEVEYYSDYNYSNVIEQFAVSKNSIYGKVSKVIASATDDKTYRNYRLPVFNVDHDDVFYSTTVTFFIDACKIEAPIINNSYFQTNGLFEADEIPHIGDTGANSSSVSATYKGFDYKLEQFLGIDNWNNTDYYANGEYWNVTIDGKAVDPDTFVMRNVKRGADSQPTSYNVSISPRENYEWRDGSAKAVYTIALTISPYMLQNFNVKWNESFTYSGEEIVFDRTNYQINTFNNDEVYFDLKLSTIGRTPIYEKDEDGKPTETIIGYGPVVNAGNYAVLIVGLQGSGANNYTLPQQSDTESYPDGYGFQHSFVVNRKQIADYSGTIVVNGKFNGDIQHFSILQKMLDMGMVFENAGEKEALAFSAAITCSQNPASGASAPVSTQGASAYLAGDFSAKLAGYYTVKLQMNPLYANNYCWADEDPAPLLGSENGKTYIWKDFAVIERAEVTPVLSDEQQMISDKAEYVDMSKVLTGLIEGASNPVYKIVEFGEVNGSRVSADQRDVDWDSANGKYIEGDYYVLIKIIDGLESSCSFGADNEYFKKNSDGSAKVLYSVSSGAVNIKLRVSDYIFGDNLGASGITLSDVIKIVSTNMQDVMNEPVYTFYTDAQLKNKVAESNMVNGLPRNAGTYYVQTTISFTDDHEDWTNVSEIAVKQRELQPVWSVDGVEVNSAAVSKVYDKSSHTVTVAVTPLAQAADVSVSISGGTGIVNACSLSWTSSDIVLTGSESGNYAIASDASFAFEISRIVITVTADSSSIIYGNILNVNELTFKYTGEFLSGDYDNQLSLFVYNSSGVRITDFSAPLSRGTYSIVPVWNGEEPTTVGNYQTNKGNYTLNMQTANLAVISKTLTVTLHSGASSSYGDANVDLYQKGVIYSADIDMTVDEFKSLVKLTAINGSNSATDTNAPAGSYKLSAELAIPDGDYDLTVVYADGSEAVYTIKQREVTIAARDIDHEYGLALQQSYTDYYDIVKGSVLESDLGSNGKITTKPKVYKYNGHLTGVSSLDKQSIGQYLFGFSIDNISFMNDKTNKFQQNSDGKYQYEISDGNYLYTVIMADFTIIPRSIEITFNQNGTSVYGDQIDLFRQKDGLPASNNKDYIICAVSRLVNDNKLVDAVTLTLVDGQGNEVTSVVNAGEYQIKATSLANGNYKIKDGQNDGEYIVGGKYVVSARPLTLTINASGTSLVYGNTLAQEGITLGYTDNGNVVNGDTLGVTLGIYSAATDTVIENISAQDVGEGYYIGLTCANTNYNVSYTKVPFKITARAVTVTPNAVTNHIYGNAIATGELTFVGNNFVSDSHLNGLGVTAKVYNNGNPVENVASLAVGSYEIRLAYASSDNNYTVTLNTAEFKVVERSITIAATAVLNHVYGKALAAGELAYEITSDLDIIGTDDLEISVKVYDGTEAVSNENISKLPIGSYTIKVSYTPNANYVVNVADAEFKVVSLKLTITYLDGVSSVYGEEVDLTKAFTVDGVLLDGDELIVTAKNDDGVDASKTAPAGVYKVEVKAPNDNYQVIYSNAGTFYMITRRTVKLAAQGVVHTYGNAFTGTLGYDYAANSPYKVVSGDDIGVTAQVYNDGKAVANADIAKLTVGNYSVKLTCRNVNGNYTVELGNPAVFEVVPRDITVSFVAVSKTFGEAVNLNEAVSYNSSDLVNGDTMTISSVKDGKPMASVNPAVGDYVVTVAVNNNYNIVYTANSSGVYSITPADITVNQINGYKNVYDAQFHGITDIQATTVTGGSATVLYIASETEVTGSISDLDWSTALSTAPTYSNVITIYLYYRISAENHNTVYGESSIEITPANIQITSNTLVDGKEIVYDGNAHSFGKVIAELVDGSLADVRYIVTDKNGSVADYQWDSASSDIQSCTNVGEYTVHVRISANNHITQILTADMSVTQATLTVTAKDCSVVYGSDFVSDLFDYSYESNVDSWNDTILQGYLDKLTYSTNYTTITSAGDANVTVTPVYSDGSDANVKVVCVGGKVTVDAAEIVIVEVTSGHASGAYTGEEFSLFGTLTASSVNSQTIVWYYREVGQSNDEWVEYKNSTITDVCEKQFEVKAAAANHNDKVYSQIIDFAITKNSITVKADDKSITYGAPNTIEFTGAIVGDTTLTAEKQQYYLNQITYSTDYAVTTNVGEVAITSAYAGDGNVAVTVTSGVLKILERSITITFVNNGSSVYGDEVNLYSSDVFTCESELVNGDSLSDIITINAVNNGQSATEANAHAGQYNVYVELNNTNYTIVYADGNEYGVYTIEQRPITVATVGTAKFIPLEDNSTVRGAYGKACNAVLSFADVNGEITLSESEYTISYNTVEGVGQTANAAPTKAGNYIVTVSLVSDGNYKFQNDDYTAELNFDVEKIKFLMTEFYWKQKVVKSDGSTSFNNVVEKFDSCIMEVVSLKKTISGDADDSLDVDYNFNENRQLCVNVKGHNNYYYVAIIKLRDSATDNYVIADSDDNTAKAEFTLARNEIHTSVVQDNWQYGDELVNPEFIIRIEGIQYSTVVEPTYLYGRVKKEMYDSAKALIDRKLNAGVGYNGLDIEEVEDLYDSLVEADDIGEFDVGYYVICVVYSGKITNDGKTELLAVRGCDVFEITKKEIDAPTINSSTFNGKKQTPDIVYGTVNGVDISTLVETDSFERSNVGKYDVTFTIKNEWANRYVWKDSNSVSTVVLWNIAKDEAGNEDGGYFTVNAIADTTYGEQITVGVDNLTVNDKANGYNGVYTWYFASKTQADAAENVISWSAAKPTQAGEYWVKAVLSGSEGNFSDKIAYGQLEIIKATLTLTPYGTITYGDKLSENQNKCNYNLDGFVFSDSVENVEFSGSVVYSIADVSLNGEKLNANSDGYALKAESTLETANYVIEVAEGKLIVERRNVSVTIGNVNSQYGLAIDLSSVTATSDDEFATAEVVANVTAADCLSTIATNESVVGNYPIVSSYTNDNYIIRYTDGSYIIDARKVGVVLSDSGIGGTYGSTITPATVTVADDETGIAEFVKGKYVITVVYNGTANDGTEFNNSVEMPTLAGNFTATVVGDASNGNFELVDIPTVRFTVNKSELDSTKITTISQMYVGTVIEPQIEDDVYNINGTVLYTVIGDHSNFVNAGRYDVILQLVDSNNYKWNGTEDATTTIDFVIASAGIYAIPYGKITYGQTASDETLLYKLVYASDGDGIHAGDDASSVVTVDESKVKFIFVDQIDRDRPLAGTYKITLADENGFVEGFTSDNYNIALQKDEYNQIVYGQYVVEKREITITVQNSESVYSQDVVLSDDFTLTEGSFAWDDNKSVIDYVTNTEANKNSDAGEYIVSAVASNDNYSVTVINGKHVINKIIVSIELQATDGIYIDKAATVSVFKIQSKNIENYVFDSDFASKVEINIVGNGYSGSKVPANAGSYKATVTGITDGNFALEETTFVTFEIAKKVVDQNAVCVKSKVYNGETQTHDIAAVENVYTVSEGVYRDAGEYEVILTLVDNSNYTWKNTSDIVVIKQFVIEKALLTLVPSGSMTYGDIFTDSLCSYTLSGFVAGDNESVVKGAVDYSLAGGVDGNRLTVKDQGYVLITEVENGYVKGLTADNYNIVAKNGKFVVNKRDITIKPVSTESIYSQEVVVSQQFEVVSGEFAFNDSYLSINYAAQLNGEAVDVGEYDITATATSNNYNITVLSGKHTIKQIKIGVVIRGINGVYGDSTKTGGVSFVSAVTTNLGSTPIQTSHIEFIINYSGKANDGTSIDSQTVPTLAGLYTVSVVGIKDKNYAIDLGYGIPSTMIEIARKEVDVRNIKAQNANYTGSKILPVIKDDYYNVNGDEVYTVSYGEDYSDGFVKVGKYTLTLTLADTNNYCWRDNLNYYTTISFEVLKANNAILDEKGEVSATAKIQISDWTVDGEVSKPQIDLINGSSEDVVFEYSTNKYVGYSTEVPHKAGTYWVRAIMAENANYNAFTSEAVSFVIHKRVVAVPVVKNLDENSVYTGFMLSFDIENFDSTIMNLESDLYVKDSNGMLTLSTLNAGTYTVKISLRDTENYVWEDAEQLTDGNFVINWTVGRRVLKKFVSGSKLFVNGEDIEFLPEGFDSNIMEIDGNVRSEKGIYTATVKIKDSAFANYEWEGTASDTIRVDFELANTNTATVAILCVVGGLCVGFGVMAIILVIMKRRRDR